MTTNNQNMWAVNKDFHAKAKMVLDEYQIKAIKAFFPKYQETSTFVPVADLAKFVLASQFDLTFYTGDGSDILKQVYGDAMVVSMETIIQQLSVAKKAFFGLDLAVLDYVIPISWEENPEVNTSLGYLHVVKTSSDEAFAAVLVQLASLLYIPNSYVHNVYDIKLLTQPEFVLNAELIVLNNVPKIDFTFLNNSLKMGPELAPGNTTGCDELKFDEVQEADFNTLLTRPIAVTTEASPCTLCLFGNMGPTPQYIQGEMKFAQNTCKQVMSYFTQPPFNMRATVILPRVDQMFGTCKGSDSEKRDLITHGVSVIPYIIEYGSPFVPNDLNNKQLFPSPATDPLDQNTNIKYPCTPNDEFAQDHVTTHNSVKPCFQVPDFGGKNMCGNPIAKPLGSTEEDEDSMGSQNFDNLFSVLLGCHWRAAISNISPDVDDIFKVGTVEFTKFARLREMILCWLLIQLVNKEYNGFRHVSDWQKLHQRLLVSHGDYAKGLKAPTTARNLIYQCLVLVQATSNFRLSFSGGLGRHFGVVHSLLGIHPTATCLPLKNFPDDTSPPLSIPFNLEVVGSSNPKVEIVDIGTTTGFVFDEQHCIHAKKLSEISQLKDESLVRNDISNFFLRWCQKCSEHNTHLLDSIKPREVKDVNSMDYEISTLEEFDAQVPLSAVKFICGELNDESLADVLTIKTILERALVQKKKSTHKSLPKSDGWIAISVLVNKKLTLEYKKGYVTRLAKMWINELHTIVFIMSHGFYWLPEKNISECLQQFIQNGGEGTGAQDRFRSSNDTVYYYPNPEVAVESFTAYASGVEFWATAEFRKSFMPRQHIQKLIAKPGPSGVSYVLRLKWFVVNPTKALFKAFLNEISLAFPNKKKRVFTSRHFPVVFEDVLTVFNDFGLVLPVTDNIAETMPAVFDLLRFNTYSLHHYGKNLEPDLLSCLKENEGNYECIFYDKYPDEKQFSNIGMAITIVIFLLNSSHLKNDNLFSDKYKGVQDLVRCNLADYKTYFHTKNCFGLDKDVNMNDEIVMANYSELLHMRFCHPIANADRYFRYSLSDVIFGLFYGSERPDDFQLPVSPPDGQKLASPVEYRLTRNERKIMNEYISREFKVLPHFYGTIGTPIVETKKVQSTKRKSTVEKPWHQPDNKLSDSHDSSSDDSSDDGDTTVTIVEEIEKKAVSPPEPLVQPNKLAEGDDGDFHGKAIGSIGDNEQSMDVSPVHHELLDQQFLSELDNPEMHKLFDEYLDNDSITQEIAESDMLSPSDLNKQIESTFAHLQELALLRATYIRAARKLTRTKKDRIPLPPSCYLSASKDAEHDIPVHEELVQSRFLRVLKIMAMNHVTTLKPDLSPAMDQRLKVYFENATKTYGSSYLKDFEHIKQNPTFKVLLAPRPPIENQGKRKSSNFTKTKILPTGILKQFIKFRAGQNPPPVAASGNASVGTVYDEEPNDDAASEGIYDMDVSIPGFSGRFSPPTHQHDSDDEEDCRKPPATIQIETLVPHDDEALGSEDEEESRSTASIVPRENLESEKGYAKLPSTHGWESEYSDLEEEEVDDTEQANQDEAADGKVNDSEKTN